MFYKSVISEAFTSRSIPTYVLVYLLIFHIVPDQCARLLVCR